MCATTCCEKSAESFRRITDCRSAAGVPQPDRGMVAYTRGRQLSVGPLDPLHVYARGDGSLLLGSFEVITPRRSTTMTATTRHFETIASAPTLFVSFELGESS